LNIDIFFQSTAQLQYVEDSEPSYTKTNSRTLCAYNETSASNS